jgi:hypothetical protein
MGVPEGEQGRRGEDRAGDRGIRTAGAAACGNRQSAPPVVARLVGLPELGDSEEKRWRALRSRSIRRGPSAAEFVELTYADAPLPRLWP